MLLLATLALSAIGMVAASAGALQQAAGGCRQVLGYGGLRSARGGWRSLHVDVFVRT
jgi:hypothetical protein